MATQLRAAHRVIGAAGFPPIPGGPTDAIPKPKEAIVEAWLVSQAVKAPPAQGALRRAGSATDRLCTEFDKKGWRR